MAEQSSGEKTEDATPRKREKARKQGTVAKSQDLTGACTLMAISFMIPWVLMNLVEHLFINLGRSITQIPTSFDQKTAFLYLLHLITPMIKGVLPLLLTVMMVALITNFAQVGFVLSGESLNPKLEKIDPFKGIKRLLSAKQLVEGLKAGLKFGIFGLICYYVIKNDLDGIAALSTMTPVAAAAFMGNLMQDIMLKVAFAWLALAALDYFFQRKQVEKQLKMTKDELKREMKEQEGSPELKSAQSRRRQELSRGGLKGNLEKAEAIVTNPTHYAVAIRYDRSEMHAPMVVAKGADYLALKIREIGADLDIPIVENPPLARTLHKQCEVGDFIPRDMFSAVAEVLAYVYKQRGKAA
jgi:flagellar biosynthetic protein FlhB